MSEKRFEATAGRLQRAKREGDIASSHELSTVAAFACALSAASFAAGHLAAAAQALLVAAASGTFDRAAFYAALFWMTVPAFCAAFGGALCGIVQAGGVNLTGIKLQFKRLAPAENLKRMISREAALTAVRATVAFLCAAFTVVPAAGALLAAALHGALPQTLAQAAWPGALRAGWAACAVGAIFACADYALQTMRRRKRLRMSYDELKRDHKEQEGDPLARGRRRALHRALSKASIQAVKKAAFVVTNPTHIAVAIEYSPPDVPVPRVLVRAADEMAAAVRETAAEQRIPLIENVPLARALYAQTKPGDYIPQETYVAVAEIVAALVKAGSLA